VPVTQSALVIGGGLAGMTAALAVADQGYDVHLVEKDAQLGGNLRPLAVTLEGADVPAFLDGLVRRTGSHPRIRVHLQSTVAEVSGHIGEFKSRIASAGGSTSVGHGVTILATGGLERPSGQPLHGAHPRVLTQRELESRLHARTAAGPEGGTAGEDGLVRQLGAAPTVVMIQCVGSRNAEHPYCSRVCCSEAVKNAIDLKARIPGARIVVLAKDIRTYGFRELYFQKAREAGILFIRHPRDLDPEVADRGGLEVRFRDAGLRRDLVLRPDLLVLSTGIAPAPDNPVLSGLLRTSLTTDGFFLEAHPKLRPVDLATEGIFICGLAHSPRFIDETIAQARATAARAATILSHAHREVPGQVSRIDALKCIACMTCVSVCPYGAPTLSEETRKTEIQGAVCMGCGSCAAACPAKAITLQHQEERQVVAMLDELLVRGGGIR
jgi:heterodisulfide reductase subunit A2